MKHYEKVDAVSLRASREDTRSRIATELSKPKVEQNNTVIEKLKNLEEMQTYAIDSLSVQVAVDMRNLGHQIDSDLYPRLSAFSQTPGFKAMASLSSQTDKKQLSLDFESKSDDVEATVTSIKNEDGVITIDVSQYEKAEDAMVEFLKKAKTTEEIPEFISALDKQYGLGWMDVNTILNKEFPRIIKEKDIKENIYSKLVDELISPMRSQEHYAAPLAVLRIIHELNERADSAYEIILSMIQAYVLKENINDAEQVALIKLLTESFIFNENDAFEHPGIKGYYARSGYTEDVDKLIDLENISRQLTKTWFDDEDEIQTIKEKKGILSTSTVLINNVPQEIRDEVKNPPIKIGSNQDKKKKKKKK